MGTLLLAVLWVALTFQSYMETDSCISHVEPGQEPQVECPALWLPVVKR